MHNFENRSGTVAKVLSVLMPGVLGPEHLREPGSLIAAGSPDRAAMTEVMHRHGLFTF